MEAKASASRRELTKAQNRETIWRRRARFSPNWALPPPRCATSSAPRRWPRAPSTIISSPRKKCIRRCATRWRWPAAPAARGAPGGDDGAGILPGELCAPSSRSSAENARTAARPADPLSHGFAGSAGRLCRAARKTSRPPWRAACSPTPMRWLLAAALAGVAFELGGRVKAGADVEETTALRHRAVSGRRAGAGRTLSLQVPTVSWKRVRSTSRLPLGVTEITSTKRRFQTISSAQ